MVVTTEEAWAPEQSPAAPTVQVNRERCAGCQECIIRCPTGALHLDPAAWICAADSSLCVGCRQCERVCPYGAITVEGQLAVPAPQSFTPAHTHPLLMDRCEVHGGIESWGAAVREAERCLACPDPTCVRGCPAHNDIPAFIRAVRDRDLERAHAILRETTVMPDICSRVCDRSTQCEGACSLKLAGGEPVAIGLLERFVTDHAPVPPLLPVADDGAGLDVAIVGAGPAGISAAWELRSHGARVTLLEKDAQALGVLRWGIPDFSLPPDVARRPLDALLAAGVELETGARITADDIPALTRDHDAVILAHGASLPLRLRVPGADLAGVEDATTFLVRAKAALAEGTPLPDVYAGTRVLVVGAGNTAMDVARSVQRLGGHATAVDWMDQRFARVRPDELEEARREGIRVRFLTSVDHLEGEGGRVAAAWLVPTRQRKAGARPLVVKGRSERMAVDLVVVAMGYRVDPAVAAQAGTPLPVPAAPPAVIPDRRWLATGLMSPAGRPTGELAMGRELYLERARTPVGERVWAAGDALSGPATVVAAMAQGRQAARSILAVRPQRPKAPVAVEAPIPVPVAAPALAYAEAQGTSQFSALGYSGACLLMLGVVFCVTIVGFALGVICLAGGCFLFVAEGARIGARRIVDRILDRPAAGAVAHTQLTNTTVRN